MKTNNPYCTLADIKGLLGLQSTANDAWISSLIPQAQAVIDRYIGYSFQTDGTHDTPTTRVFSGLGDDYLAVGWIQEIVAVSEIVTSLAIGYDDMYHIGTPTIRDITADCVIGPENRNPGWTIERLSQFAFDAGRRNYSVAGVWGIADIPPDITRATARMVTHYIKMRDTNYSDWVNDQGGLRSTYTKKMPADVLDILVNYKARYFYAL